MNTQTESMTSVYNRKGEIVAIIKRDDKSKKSLVYMVREAKVDDIARLIEQGDNQEEV